MFLLNKKIQFFNMIEVLLALAVIAIGMTSILGLFPVGLNASRNAVAENVSADVADQMVTYLRVMGESSATAYDNTFDPTSAITTDFPELVGLNITPSGSDINIDIYGAAGTSVQTLSDDFLTAYKSDDVDTASSTYPRVASEWAVFKPAGAANLRRRVYFIVQGPNCTEDGGNRSIDYSAMALVWKSTVQIRRIDSAGAWGLYPLVPSYGEFGQLNIELSWPLELPYAERKKRYYQVVINRP